MKRAPQKLVVLAVLLVLSWRVLDLAGWDAGLDALAGMQVAGGRPMIARGIAYASAWLGAVALAPILAAAGLAWLALRRLWPPRPAP